MNYNADGIDKTLLFEVYNDASLLDMPEYRLKTPYEDIYHYCKYCKNRNFDDFFDMYLERKSVWKDMDAFDENMHGFFFRMFCFFSGFRGSERKVEKQAKRYWSNIRTTTRSDIRTYYAMSKKYSDADQFNTFLRLIKWNRLYFGHIG